MRRFIVVLITLLILVNIVFASESRLIGLNYFNSLPSYGLLFLIDDNYNIVYVGGYVNQPTNFLILEPKVSVSFENSYGMIKYSFTTPIETFNFALILNYPYPELSIIRSIIGLPITFGDVRDKVDLLIGVNKILGLGFISPYLGVGYANVFSKTETSGNIVSEQSVSQLKFTLGSLLDFKVVSLDALVNLYFPSGKNLSAVLTNNVEGGFGFNILVRPKLEFSKTAYLLGVARYFNYSLPSTITNYRLVEINAGASYNFIINNILVSFGGNFVNINEYEREDQTPTYIQNTYLLVPIYVSFEVPIVSWFVMRGGLSSSVYSSYITYTESTTTNTVSSSPRFSALSLGFSLVPINNLSVDWVVSYNFLGNVFVNGRLPWILSGNNFFDNVTSQISFEYKM